MEKKIDLLKFSGNVMRFGEFCKMNERLEVEIMAPDDIVVMHDFREILDVVGSKIEQICGWDICVLMKYIGNEYQLEDVSDEDLVMWIHQQVQEYFKPDVEIIDKFDSIKKDKEAEFAIALGQLDFGMCVEKIVRQLKGLEENDEKYPPNYFKKMADMMAEYLEDGEKE